MNKDFICEVICERKKCQKQQIVYRFIPSKGMDFKKIRDLLITAVKITEENSKENYYLAVVEGGASSFSNTLMAIGIDKENIHIASYAEEGFIKQKIAENNAQRVVNCLSGMPIKKTAKINMLVVFVCVCVAALIILPYLRKQDSNIEIPEVQSQESNVVPIELDNTNIQELIDGYNIAIDNYNNIASEYNKIVKGLSIANIDNLKVYVEEKKPIDGNDLNDSTIVDMTNQLQEELETLLSEYSIVYKLDNLSEIEIVNSIQSMQNVLTVSPVTKDNDPNKLLEKENGYLSCVYFSLDIINQDDVPGKTTIEKGTDCGGCVELYENIEDAENRIEYLSQFDNSLLYSGSYAVVGKMVIRTSYLLDNQQQIKITEQIVKAIIE